MAYYHIAIVAPVSHGQTNDYIIFIHVHATIAYSAHSIILSLQEFYK